MPAPRATAPPVYATAALELFAEMRSLRLATACCDAVAAVPCETPMADTEKIAPAPMAATPTPIALHATMLRVGTGDREGGVVTAS